MEYQRFITPETGINQDLARNLEEEKIDPYEMTKERLKAARVEIRC